MSTKPLRVTPYDNGDLMIQARSDGASVYLTKEMIDLLMAMQSLPEPFAFQKLPQFMQLMLGVTQVRMSGRPSSEGIRASQQRGRS